MHSWLPLRFAIIVACSVFIYKTDDYRQVVSRQRWEAVQNEPREESGPFDALGAVVDENLIGEPESEHTIPANVTIRDAYAIEAPRGAFSIYPFDPLQVYRGNIQRAEGGAARSQYMVAEALSECRQVPSDEEFDELSANFYNQNEMLAGLQSKRSYCANLFEQFPPDVIDEEYKKWHESALNNGDKMALVVHWHESYNQIDQLQAQEILEDALYYGDSRIYTYISLYYSRYDEVRSSVKSASWQLIRYS